MRTTFQNRRRLQESQVSKMSEERIPMFLCPTATTPSSLSMMKLSLRLSTQKVAFMYPTPADRIKFQGSSNKTNEKVG